MGIAHLSLNSLPLFQPMGCLLARWALLESNSLERELCINVKIVITPAKGENKWHLAFINAYIITLTRSHLHVEGL